MPTYKPDQHRNAVITSYEQLPAHYQELYKTLPPQVRVPKACAI